MNSNLHLHTYITSDSYIHYKSSLYSCMFFDLVNGSPLLMFYINLVNQISLTAFQFLYITDGHGLNNKACHEILPKKRIMLY